MTKSLQQPIKTFQDNLVDIKRLLISFTKLANISIPLYIRKENRAMHITAQFKDTPIEFRSTSIKHMYTDSIEFIEEMNTKYQKNKNYLTK